MSKLTDIKKRITELEGGAFQELCDALLSRCGYEGIHAYGMQAGTMKTTKGNPDTYFKTDTGKYIFVAYTTQQDDLFKKAEKDIEKCLDTSKIGILCEDIEEIIFAIYRRACQPEKTRACLKNAFREMCFTLGGEFIPNL